MGRLRHFRPIHFNFPNDFPYTNIHDLNLDWILALMRTFEDTYNNLEDIIREIVQEEIEETLYNKIIDMLGFINVCNPPAPLVALDKTGAEDCTDKFNAMQEYAVTKGHCILYFPAGTYAFRPVTLRRGICLIGECKYDTTLSLMGNSKNSLIYGELNEVTIANICLSANIQGQSADTNCIDCTVNDVEILNVNLKSANIGAVLQENGGHLYLDKIGVDKCTYGALQFNKGTLPDDFCPADPDDYVLPTTDMVIDCVYVGEFVGHVAEFVIDNHVNQIDIQHVYNVAELPQWVLINDGKCVNIEIRTDGVDNYDHNDSYTGHIKINCANVWDFFVNVFSKHETLNLVGVNTSVKTQTLSTEADNINELAKTGITGLYGARETIVNNDDTERIYGRQSIHVNGNQETQVDGDRIVTVDKNDTSVIKGDRSAAVAGNDTAMLDGNQDISVMGNQTITVTGDQSFTADNQSFTSTGDQYYTVGKNRRVDVTGGDSLSVGQNRNTAIGGKNTTKVTGNDSLTAASQDITVNGARTVTADKLTTTVYGDNTAVTDGDSYNTVGGNRTTTITGDDSRQCNNDTQVVNNDSNTTVHGDCNLHVGETADFDVSGDMTLDVGIDLTVQTDNDITLKSNNLVLDSTEPLTYKTPTYTAGYFSYVPAKDKQGNPYKILTDYDSSANIDQAINKIVKDAIADIPKPPAVDPVWEQNYHLNVYDDVLNITYYVDGVNGDDDNDGSSEHPFKTLKRAMRPLNDCYVGRSYVGIAIVSPGIYYMPTFIINSVLYIKNFSDGTVTLDNSLGKAYFFANSTISLNNIVIPKYGDYHDSDRNCYAINCALDYTMCIINAFFIHRQCLCYNYDTSWFNGLVANYCNVSLVTLNTNQITLSNGTAFPECIMYSMSSRLWFRDCHFTGGTTYYPLMTANCDIHIDPTISGSNLRLDMGTFFNSRCNTVLYFGQEPYNQIVSLGNISQKGCISNYGVSPSDLDEYEMDADTLAMHNILGSL